MPEGGVGGRTAAAEGETDELERVERLVERVEVPVGRDGHRVVARSAGQGPPVVLLHGGSGSWNHWVRTIPALAERFSIVAFDLPGFGESSLPPGTRSAHDLARVTAEAIVAVLGECGYGLVGFSFGGIVAGLVAARPDARVNRLVLIGAGGLGLRTAVDRPLRAVPAGASEAERWAAHRHNLAALMLADPANVDDLAVRMHDVNVARSRFRTGSIPSSATLADALPAVRAPLTAIAGSQDAFASDGGAERAQRLVALRPDCELVTVAAAGHWAMYERPGTVNALLADRLARPG